MSGHDRVIMTFKTEYYKIEVLENYENNEIVNHSVLVSTEKADNRFSVGFKRRRSSFKFARLIFDKIASDEFSMRDVFD